MQYRDLYALFRREPEAKRYFDALPTHVQDRLRTRPNGINSMADLKDHAAALLRGGSETEGFEWHRKA